MNKRVVAAALAVALAIVGVVTLVTWANDADERAFDGAELATVLQVTRPVPAGTKAEELDGYVEQVELPKAAVAPGALSDLATVSGLQTTAKLELGEQVIRARFGKPGTKTKDPLSSVPTGLQEISVALSAERRVGGVVRAGDTVGVFASYDINNKPTNVLANRVLVVRVTTRGPDGQAGNEAVGGGPVTFVTLAVTAKQAKEIVNVTEFGWVWLTRQNEQAETSVGPPIVAKDVLE